MIKIFTLIGISLIITNIYANQDDEREILFSTQKLEDVASQLSEAYLISHDTILLCPTICGNKSLVINYNEQNQVVHLGVSMFSKEIKKLLNEPVCNFVERFLLELLLTDDVDETVSMLDHYGVLIQKNGVRFGQRNIKSIRDILNEIEDPVSFALSKDEKTYTVAWEYGLQNLFAMQFPLNRELISGTNKLEADNVLFEQLKGNNCNNLSAQTNANLISDDLTSTDSIIYIRTGTSFILGEINENTYYKKASAGYELIFDENFPKESLSNLFLGNFEDCKLKIQITHSMYGNYNPEFEMSLNDFICFFKQDFKVYTVSYQKTPDVINATVIFQNKLYDFIHLLIITTKKDSLFDKNGVITASFRSNIPQHNINSIVRDLVKDNQTVQATVN